MKSIAYKDGYLKRLRDPEFAKGLLNSAFNESIEDGDWESFGLLLQDIVQASGNVKAFAKKAKVSRQHLYRLFEKDANPTLDTLSPVLATLGLKLTLTD